MYYRIIKISNNYYTIDSLYFSDSNYTKIGYTIYIEYPILNNVHFNIGLPLINRKFGRYRIYAKRKCCNLINNFKLYFIWEI